MKEIVKHILQEETEAKNKLEAARTQASAMIAQAKKEMQTRMEEKISTTQRMVEKDMEELTKKFLLEKEKILQAAKEEAILLHQKNAKTIRERAHAIFQALIILE
jgi:F0F1-type ATP synthase membrane subunit b/b'